VENVWCIFLTYSVVSNGGKIFFLGFWIGVLDMAYLGVGRVGTLGRMWDEGRDTAIYEVSPIETLLGSLDVRHILFWAD